jgi:hypothetical protein
MAPLRAKLAALTQVHAADDTAEPWAGVAQKLSADPLNAALDVAVPDAPEPEVPMQSAFGVIPATIRLARPVGYDGPDIEIPESEFHRQRAREMRRAGAGRGRGIAGARGRTEGSTLMNIPGRSQLTIEQEWASTPRTVPGEQQRATTLEALAGTNRELVNKLGHERAMNQRLQRENAELRLELQKTQGTQPRPKPKP